MNIDYIFIAYLFALCIVLNLFFFVIAFIFKSDVFTDITYALTFLLSTTIILAWKQQFSIIQILIYSLVFLWSIRLGGYLFKRIIKIKHDKRFDNIRNSFIKFLGFWLLQGTSVFLIVMPASFALTIPKEYFDDTNYISYAFILIALLGLIFETIGDEQKNKFYNTKEKKKEFIDTGLWKISRHPNYFGEMVFWLFLTSAFLTNFIMKNNSDSKIYLQLLWFLSPVYIICLLLFLSGVPILERNAYKKFKDNDDYQNYVKKTSIVFPFIGKKGYTNKVKKMQKKR
ncbi:DUF1295 domain-containing protein [Spiroplasma monobiae]|uniref:Steroid 5-alpha reductase C-terminal domain-containing protein n=1 Tax=Spiroplasma monobiae MQ-1 TaxID=1336748 RepID=A0A2K9LUI5_SPISQ|nr:DUF1295 domain-containing protein [Spiroplasma monobiae]AUM62712.1 hypothetical protein SMONO_v1c04630 [Spiroplasma monobiae MQ-1]